MPPTPLIAALGLLLAPSLGHASVDLAQISPSAYTIPLLDLPLQDGPVPRIHGLALQAWQDDVCADGALQVDYFDAQGRRVGHADDLVRPAPFAGGPGSYAWLEPPVGAASAKLLLTGHGPCAGHWSARPVMQARLLPPSAEAVLLCRAGALQVYLGTDGRSFELQAPGRLLARLRLGEGWRFERFKLPSAWAGPMAELYVLGPQGQRGQLSVKGEPLLAPGEGVSLDLRLQGAKPSDFSLSLEPQGGDWLLPFNQGLRVPLDQAGPLSTGYDLALRAGHFLSMPALGWAHGTESLLLWCQDPADGYLRWSPREQRAGLVWKASQGAWQGDWRLRLRYQPEGGAVAWSQQARRFQLAALREAEPGREPELSLAQRAQTQPALARLAGAVNIHYWKKAAWWSNEPHPEALAAEMKAAGLDRVLWSQTASPEAVAAMNAQGWLAGSYENFQDVYPAETPMNWVNRDGWPEQAVRLRHGDWQRGWPATDGGKTYYAAVRSARAAVDYVHGVLDARKARGQSAVFLDTTTATGPVEDWSIAHPMNRSQDLAAKMRQLAYGSGLGLVVGSESGHDGALPYLAYFEGMQSPWPGRFDDAGYDLSTIKAPTEAMQRWDLSPRDRAPLFDLAWHGSYVGYEYWGDAANRLPEQWRRKDLFSVLYAQPQLWILDEERWKDEKDQAIKSYKTWSPVVRHLFGQRMTDWKILDPSGDVQETDWEDGSVIRVDFAKDSFELSGPVKRAGAR